MKRGEVPLEERQRQRSRDRRRLQGQEQCAPRSDSIFPLISPSRRRWTYPTTGCDAWTWPNPMPTTGEIKVFTPPEWLDQPYIFDWDHEQVMSLIWPQIRDEFQHFSDSMYRVGEAVSNSPWVKT